MLIPCSQATRSAAVRRACSCIRVRAAVRRACPCIRVRVSDDDDVRVSDDDDDDDSARVTPCDNENACENTMLKSDLVEASGVLYVDDFGCMWLFVGFIIPDPGRSAEGRW